MDLSSDCRLALLSLAPLDVLMAAAQEAEARRPRGSRGAVHLPTPPKAGLARLARRQLEPHKAREKAAAAGLQLRLRALTEPGIKALQLDFHRTPKIRVAEKNLGRKASFKHSWASRSASHSSQPACRQTRARKSCENLPACSGRCAKVGETSAVRERAYVNFCEVRPWSCQTCPNGRGV